MPETSSENGDTASHVVEEQKQILADLCVGAPSDLIRNCLRKYCPSKTAWQIEAAMKQEKKPTLVETLAYLGIPDMDEYRSDALPHELVCRIQNLFPDICQLCSSKYCIKLTDTPIVSCTRCGQGCHNPCLLRLMGKTEEDLNESNNHGKSLINPFGQVGFIYFCGACQLEVIPQKDELKVKTGRKRTGPPASQTTNAAAPPVNTNTSEDSNTNQTNSNNEQVNSNAAQRQAVQQHPPSGNSTPPPSDAASRGQGAQSNICKFYKDGRCKYGISGRKGSTCNYEQPKACPKYLVNGNRTGRGCSNNQCRLFHPKMCNSSLRDRICYKADCRFIHIRGTKRTRTSSTSSSERVRNMSEGGHNQRPSGSASGARTGTEPTPPFLEQLKIISAQIAQLANKVQDLEKRQSHPQPQVPHPQPPTMAYQQMQTQPFIHQPLHYQPVPPYLRAH